VDAISGLGPVPLAEIDERHVEAWKSGMGGLAGVTIRRKLVALSRFFRWARQQRLVDWDPVEFVSKPRKVRKVESSVSMQHYGSLLEECRTHSERALLGCLFWAGCRRQEVADLTIGSVDMARANLTVMGKGGDARLIPMAPRLKPLLSDHLKTRRCDDRQEPLFVNRDGTKLSTRTVNRVFARLCKRAGLGQHGYTPHAARRGIAALMATEGFSMFDIQEFLGHEDPKTTARYVQASAGSIRRRMADSEVFGEEQTETIPTDRVTRLESKVDDLTAAIASLVGRLSAPAEEGVYPIGDAPQPRNAVGDQRQGVSGDQTVLEQPPQVPLRRRHDQHG